MHRKIAQFSVPEEDFFHSGDLVLILLKDAYYEVRAGIVLDPNVQKTGGQEALKLRVFRSGVLYNKSSELQSESLHLVDYTGTYIYSRICHAERIRNLNNLALSSPSCTPEQRETGILLDDLFGPPPETEIWPDEDWNF